MPPAQTIFATRPAPPLAPARHGLGACDVPVLAELAAYHALTAEQVRRLLYGRGSLRHAQEKLRVLADELGYAQRVARPPTRTGRSAAVFTLSAKGRAFVAKELGLPLPPRYRPGELAGRSPQHWPHTLAIADVLIAFTLLTRNHPSIQVAAMRHERELKRHPVKVDVVRPGTGELRRSVVIPDGWVDLRLALPAGAVQECYALEVDRGTEYQAAWRDKVAALLAFADGPYQAAFGTPSLTIAVVATTGPERARQLVAWTEAELRRRNAEGDGPLFRVVGADPAVVSPEELFLASAWFVPFALEPIPLIALEEAGTG